ncbi:LCP family protein [Streptomyces turgidiscabies]|uniref:LCP family protein required for cell wall assembly n=1 Tax=Streptomyces turgidiscabies TaxID=85558 RepID=A0ABU0RVM1_9ACTN|nr:LCP family protein [Streptomyces turgidiscabies]MDQ0935207.1 LCP family protein required for cell wall assembly [Streptomyces turgidiscabies]
MLVTGSVLGISAFQAPSRAPHAMNILLMGTDGRDTISPEEKERFHAGGVACDCTDVMMLVHVSALRDRISVVSLPRDSLADIPEYRDDSSGQEFPARPAKLNNAFAEGGAPLTVRTVEAMTHVNIDRYLQVDFRRFMDAVDAIGGVEVCTARPLKDSATKLDLPPGKHRLSGGQALQYVRSRHVDGSADLGRIQRQQRFLVSVMHELKHLTSDPVAMARVAHALLDSAQADPGFGVGELVDLASSLSRIPLSSTEFTTVPVAGFNPLIAGVGSTLRWDDKKVDQEFGKLRDDRPLIPRGQSPRPDDPPRFSGYAPVRGSSLACS